MWLETPSVGSVVGGKYRLTRALGVGGMSLVFAAENTVTNKQVALKFLLASFADRPDARARLLREARAASRIKHRNVVDLYDVGFEGEAMFLVMDLLEGHTLARELESTTMSIPALLRLLIPAMRGVAEAHRQGVVHRDIKPDNIFLAREVDHSEPVVTVLDFGIAKLDGDSLTHSGKPTGTPVFMSVEQIRGDRDLDARVDVYGFGVILYMALAGRLPIVAQSYPELIYKLTSTLVPPLSRLRPELDNALSELVARAMAREREDRTPTLEQLIRELTPFAQGGDELGLTQRVRYGQDVEPMPTTMPAGALPGAEAPPATAPTRETKDEPRPIQEALRTPTIQGPAHKRRWPWAVAALGTLGLVGGSMLTARDTPRSTKPRPAAVAALTAPEGANTTPVAAIAPNEEDVTLESPVSSATTFVPDASGSPARRPATAHARKATPKIAADQAPASPVPPRRRLAREDFFGAAQQP